MKPNLNPSGVPVANLSLLNGALVRLETAVHAGDLPGQVRGVVLALDAVHPLVTELAVREPGAARSPSHLGGECYRLVDLLLGLLPAASTVLAGGVVAWADTVLRAFLEWLRALLRM